jgi:hypothetical protein
MIENLGRALIMEPVHVPYDPKRKNAFVPKGASDSYDPFATTNDAA